MTTALVAPVLLGLVLGAITVATFSNQQKSAQNGADAAALAGATLFARSSVTPEEIEAEVRRYLTGNLNRAPRALPANAVVKTDMNAKSVNVSFTGLADDTISSPIWDGLMTVRVNATARWGRWPVPICILITEPLDNHTLRSSNNSKTDLRSCMVQVNTANWDAVEAADGSYIHVIDGQSCYVGNIHFGDVTPAKSENCTFFQDPFAGYKVPSQGCTHTNYNTAASGGSLSPGVYCGGLQVVGSAKFSPGVYYIKDGIFKVSGAVNIDAEGVTFVLTGNKAAVRATGIGRWDQSPATGPGAGQWAGFLFFLDPATLEDAGSVSRFTGIQYNGNGIIYLAGQKLVLGTGTSMKLNPGTMVAHYLLPQGGDMDFTGSLATSTVAEVAMRKPMKGGAILVN